MTPREVWLLSAKGLLAWLALSALLGYFGDRLVTSLFPLLKAVMMAMNGEFSPSLRLLPLADAQMDWSIELSAWTLRPVYLNADHYIPPGTELKSSAHLLHVLVPLVIQGVICLVWPARTWTQRSQIVGFGLLTAMLVVLATLPALLLGHLEISFQSYAQSGSNPRPAPWLMDWMVFCEMGGNWLLAIAAAWLAIQFPCWLPTKRPSFLAKP